MPKISIIVPVYKAEKCLHSCIDSILAQTFKDFEVLLINDGSPDKSGIICDEYALRDSRIQVFHKENGGVSSARNLGLDNAKGDIICFIDSDDVIDSYFLENFGEIEYDITIQGIYVKYPNSIKEQYLPIENGIYYKNDIINFVNVVNKANNIGYLVTRRFKRTIIESANLRFNPKYKVREDEEFIWRYLCYCQTFNTINKGAYHYDMPNFALKYKFVDLDSDFECTKSIIENFSKFTNSKNHPLRINNINRLASLILKSYIIKPFDLNKTKNYLKVFCTYYTNTTDKNKFSNRCKLVFHFMGRNIPNWMHKLYNIALSVYTLILSLFQEN